MKQRHFNFHFDSLSGKVAVFLLPEVEMDATEIVPDRKSQMRTAQIVSFHLLQLFQAMIRAAEELI